MTSTSTENELKRELQEESALYKADSEVGGLWTFNMEHGYLEAIVRGMRSGFLRDYEYKQLSNCDTLEDLKLALTDTDYVNAMQESFKSTSSSSSSSSANSSSNSSSISSSSVLSSSSRSTISPHYIHERCTEKFIADFSYLRSQAVGHLSTFLEYITHSYMIDAIHQVVRCLKNSGVDEQTWNELPPLGRSPHLKSVVALFDKNTQSGEGVLEIYRTILVDTPVATYFDKYFGEQFKSETSSESIAKHYSTMDVEIIKYHIERLWLEDFYSYCKDLGGDTAEVMGELLEWEADKRAVLMTLHSFNSSLLNSADNRTKERRDLYCSFGRLYPDVTINRFSNVSKFDQLKEVLHDVPIFKDIAAKANDELAFEQLVCEFDIRMLRSAFDGQSHFAPFWAFACLKEYELKNILYIAQIVGESNKSHMKFFSIFK
eukprot:TRINITY_DN196_c0_g1_i2.p1 TRINITY_DN196_c0_g1~~TRINITY_DN196_c0_g1_i2.p1  ORF type:complete len:432 (+),score=107.99 TRINITY_DN196_c0_g1_i2:81-1376(+)